MKNTNRKAGRTILAVFAAAMAMTATASVGASAITPGQRQTNTAAIQQQSDDAAETGRTPSYGPTPTTPKVPVC